MSQTFEISYWWEKLSEPDYFVEMVDTTRVVSLSTISFPFTRDSLRSVFGGLRRAST
jgi:hypothetical protein